MKQCVPCWHVPVELAVRGYVSFELHMYSLIQIKISKTCSATCFTFSYPGIYRQGPCNMKQLEVKAKGLVSSG